MQSTHYTYGLYANEHPECRLHIRVIREPFFYVHERFSNFTVFRPQGCFYDAEEDEEHSLTIPFGKKTFQEHFLTIPFGKTFEEHSLTIPCGKTFEEHSLTIPCGKTHFKNIFSLFHVVKNISRTFSHYSMW